MSLKAETGLLSVVLALSSANGLAQEPQPTKAGAEFQFSVGEEKNKIYILVDCDLLSAKGALSSAFLKQMDIWGHLDVMEKRFPNMKEDAKIFTFKQHLQAHGISSQKIEKAAQYCKENFILSR